MRGGVRLLILRVRGRANTLTLNGREVFGLRV